MASPRAVLWLDQDGGAFTTDSLHPQENLETLEVRDLWTGPFHYGVLLEPRAAPESGTLQRMLE
jgi:hypothetical protein